MTPRSSWDEYFLDIAHAVSRRATCHRAQVGVVVVDTDHTILATGYNGALPGEPHCPDDESLDPDDHCDTSIHAEQNAIAHAARRGTRLEGATWYLWGRTHVHPWYGANGLCNTCDHLVRATKPLRIMSEVG